MNEQFSTYFLANIKPLLIDLNRKRKAILYKNYFSIYVVYIILISCSFTFPQLNDYRLLIIIFGLIICLFLALMIYSFGKAEKQYYSQLKKIFIPKILETYSDNIEYFEDKYIPANIFFQSGLIKQKFHKSTGKDLMIVKTPNYRISFSYINTFEIVYRNARASTNRHTTTLYKGKFIIIDLESSKIPKLDLSTIFKDWNYTMHTDRIYLSKESSLKFCEPSLFRDITKSETFLNTFNQINEIFDLRIE